MPSFLVRLLDSSWFGYLARAALTFIFWSSGIAKLVDFQAAQGEMAQFGLNPPAAFALATAATQLVGSLLIILNRWTWLGCGMLATFTALTIPVAHRFWEMQEPLRTLEFYFVMEHLTVIGALAVMAILSRRLGGAGNGPVAL
ncbi:MAG: DoxX family protein [Rhizobiales bacterium 65-9]|nr:DoxX family protein [Hyphomicrobiales bacterium]OJY32825.1 MAG: DoxX family protein [Rhizobiales bacterium 65-9]